VYPLPHGRGSPGKNVMNFLALETSCDETAAAVFTDDLAVLSSVVASQTDLHARFGGVVPEIASRAHLRNLLPVIDEALARAGIALADVGCVAVHNTPGLVGALLVGVSAAKMLALALGVPLVAVNHVQSHVFACRMAAGRDIFPCVGLVVSGGHTALFRCESALAMTLLGGTRDDAAGEAFDKVAAILGLGFPGGPAVEREAAAGDPKAYDFPRAFHDDARLEFSFSGLKTAVLYACHGQDVSRATPPPPGRKRADLAASFQAAVVDALVLKCKQALRKTGLTRLAVGGGVSANKTLRAALAAMCAKEGAELFIPPLSLCTDNAAMAALAVEKWKRGELAPPDLDAEPNWL
jgi:N6-L-threonylcarbamoyladenine synthase